MVGIDEGLKRLRERRDTLHARADYVTGKLRAAGFPLLAMAVHSHVVLLSGDDGLLDEVEVLLETLDGRPG